MTNNERVNTHEKLLNAFLIKSMYNFFEMRGYRGSEGSFVIDLIGAIASTTAYTYDSRDLETGRDLTENEYLEMLVSEMNFNY